MNFDLDDQQVALQSSIQKFLATAGEPALERVIRDGYSFDRVAWKRLAVQIGVPGLAIAEEYGGSGATAVEAVLALETLGTACYPSPMVSTAVSALLLGRLAAECPAAADLLGEIASGEAVVALALPDYQPGGSPVQTDGDADTVSVSGTIPIVRDAATATHVIVAAHSGTRLQLALVATGQDGVTVESERGFDPGCETGTVTLSEATGTRLSEGGHEVFGRILADHNLALSAECLGLAAGALNRAVEWAVQREQFGRPIGVLQSIKHMCADTLMEVETARVLVYYASTLVDEEAATYSLAVSHAKAQASSAARTATANLIQVLGGIGFTWEHPAHLYFKRARVDGILGGTATDHLDRIADAVLPAKG